MNHFITFATSDYLEPAQHLSFSARKVGGFDKCSIFNAASIDQMFRLRNRDIFEYPGSKGAGYYIWKPYIIFHYLLSVPDDDLVCYCDALYLFKSSIIDHVSNWMSVNPHPVAIAENKPNEDAVSEAFVSKGDAFFLLNAVPQGNQAWAGFVAVKKSPSTLQFVSEWLARVQDVRVVSDAESSVANYPGFFANRYDQTVLSVIAKRWGISFFHFPCGPLQNNRKPF